MPLTENNKRFIKKVIIGSNAFEAAARFSPGMVILSFHSVKEEPSEYDDIITKDIIHSTAIFDKHMELLARQFNPISLDDLSDILAGRRARPRKAVLVTFDDGYTDNLEFAAPILNRYGIPGTFYITVNAIDNNWVPWYVRLRYCLWHTPFNEWNNPFTGETVGLANQADKANAFIQICRACATLYGSRQESMVDAIVSSLKVDESEAYKGLMLSWDQVRQLVHMGHTVGSHTLSHPNLARIGLDDLNKEILASKNIIEQNIDASIDHFSYPNPGALHPNWTDQVAAVVKKAGYKTAVTTNSGNVKPGDNPFTLSRVWVPHEKYEFLWVLNWSFMGRRM